MPGVPKMTRFLLTTLFALAISFLTFAASFAEVPRSEMQIIDGQQQ